MHDDEQSGKEIIRLAMAARNRRLNLGRIARDVGVPSTTLEAFITGSASLTPEVLNKLADWIWGGTMKYAADVDRIQPAQSREGTPIGKAPGQYKPTSWQKPLTPDDLLAHAPKSDADVQKTAPRRSIPSWIRW
jgi:hypothetical protein